MARGNITSKREMFAHQYIGTMQAHGRAFNGAEAARRAGYKHPKVMAERLLNVPAVPAEIARLLRELYAGLQAGDRPKKLTSVNQFSAHKKGRGGMSTNGTRPHVKSTRVIAMPSRPGSLSSLQLKLWRGLVKAEAILNQTLEAGEPPEFTLKALNSFTQVAMAYLKSIQAASYNTHPVCDDP